MPETVMRITLIAGMLLLVVASGCRRPSTATTAAELKAPPMPAQAIDLRQMYATWKIVDSSRSGDAKQRDLEMSIHVEGEYMTFLHKDGKSGDKFRFGINADSSPKQIDLRDSKAPPAAKKNTAKGPAPDPAVMPGLYEFNGDELVLVIDWTPGSEKRPASLDEKPEGKIVRLRLERVK